MQYPDARPAEQSLQRFERSQLPHLHQQSQQEYAAHLGRFSMLEFSPQAGRLRSQPAPLPTRFAAKKRVRVSRQVLDMLTAAAEELNQAQAEVEYRKALKQKSTDLAASGQQLEALVLEDILQGRIRSEEVEAAMSQELQQARAEVAAEVAAAREVLDGLTDGQGAPGEAEGLRQRASSTTIKMLAPRVLRGLPSAKRWGHFQLLHNLAPHKALGKHAGPAAKRGAHTGAASFSTSPDSAGSATGSDGDDLERGARHPLPKESWLSIMKKRRREAYFRRLMLDLHARMDFYKRTWAAKKIQRTWRAYHNTGSGSAQAVGASQTDLLYEQLDRSCLMEAALLHAAQSAWKKAHPRSKWVLRQLSSAQLLQGPGDSLAASLAADTRLSPRSGPRESGAAPQPPPAHPSPTGARPRLSLAGDLLAALGRRSGRLPRHPSRLHRQSEAGGGAGGAQPTHLGGSRRLAPQSSCAVRLGGAEEEGGGEGSRGLSRRISLAALRAGISFGRTTRFSQAGSLAGREQRSTRPSESGRLGSLASVRRRISLAGGLRHNSQDSQDSADTNSRGRDEDSSNSPNLAARPDKDQGLNWPSQRQDSCKARHRASGSLRPGALQDNVEPVLVALSTVATGEPDHGADSPTRHITPSSHPRGRNSLWRTWDGVTELLPLNRSQAHRSGSLRPPSRHTDPPLASQPEAPTTSTEDHDGGGDVSIAVAHQHATSRTSSCVSDSASEQPAGRQVPGGLCAQSAHAASCTGATSPEGANGADTLSGVGRSGPATPPLKPLGEQGIRPAAKLATTGGRTAWGRHAAAPIPPGQSVMHSWGGPTLPHTLTTRPPLPLSPSPSHPYILANTGSPIDTPLDQAMPVTSFAYTTRQQPGPGPAGAHQPPHPPRGVGQRLSRLARGGPPTSSLQQQEVGQEARRGWEAVGQQHSGGVLIEPAGGGGGAGRGDLADAALQWQQQQQQAWQQQQQQQQAWLRGSGPGPVQQSIASGVQPQVEPSLRQTHHAAQQGTPVQQQQQQRQQEQQQGPIWRQQRWRQQQQQGQVPYVAPEQLRLGGRHPGIMKQRQGPRLQGPTQPPLLPLPVSEASWASQDPAFGPFHSPAEAPAWSQPHSQHPSPRDITASSLLAGHTGKPGEAGSGAGVAGVVPPYPLPALPSRHQHQQRGEPLTLPLGTGLAAELPVQPPQFRSDQIKLGCEGASLGQRGQREACSLSSQQQPLRLSPTPTFSHGEVNPPPHSLPLPLLHLPHDRPAIAVAGEGYSQPGYSSGRPWAMASAAACSDKQTAKSGREGRGSGSLVGKHVGSQDLSFSGTRPRDDEVPAELPAVDGLRSFAAASGAIGKAVGYDPRDRSGRNARQSCRRGGDYSEVDEEEAVEVLVGLVAAAAAASADHEVMGSTLGPGVGSAEPQVAARYALQEMVAAAAAAPWWRSRDKRAVVLPAIKNRPPPLFGRGDEGTFIGRSLGGHGHTHTGSVTSVDGVGQQGTRVGQEPLLVEPPPVAAPPPSPAAGLSPGCLSSGLAPPLRVRGVQLKEQGRQAAAGGKLGEGAVSQPPAASLHTSANQGSWPAGLQARLYPAGYPSISAMIAHEALTIDGDMRPCLTIPSNAARTREEALVGGSGEDSDSGSYSTMVGSEQALPPDAVIGTDLSIGKRLPDAPPAVSPRAGAGARACAPTESPMAHQHAGSGAAALPASEPGLLARVLHRLAAARQPDFPHSAADARQAGELGHHPHPGAPLTSPLPPARASQVSASSNEGKGGEVSTELEGQNGADSPAAGQGRSGDMSMTEQEAGSDLAFEVLYRLTRLSHAPPPTPSCWQRPRLQRLDPDLLACGLGKTSGQEGGHGQGQEAPASVRLLRLRQMWRRQQQKQQQLQQYNRKVHLVEAMPDAALASLLMTTGPEVIRQAGSAAARQATVRSSGKRHSRVRVRAHQARLPASLTQFGHGDARAAAALIRARARAYAHDDKVARARHRLQTQRRAAGDISWLAEAAVLLGAVRGQVQQLGAAYAAQTGQVLVVSTHHGAGGPARSLSSFRPHPKVGFAGSPLLDPAWCSMLGDPHEPPAAAMMRQPEVGEVSAPPPARPPRPGFFPCPGPHLDLSAASGPVWVSGAAGGPGTPWGHTLRKNELAAGLLAGEEGEERERLLLEKLAAQAAAGLRRHWAQSLGPAASPRGVWVKQPPLPLTGPHAQKRAGKLGSQASDGSAALWPAGRVSVSPDSSASFTGSGGAAAGGRHSSPSHHKRPGSAHCRPPSTSLASVRTNRHGSLPSYIQLPRPTCTSQPRNQPDTTCPAAGYGPLLLPSAPGKGQGDGGDPSYPGWQQQQQQQQQGCFQLQGQAFQLGSVGVAAAALVKASQPGSPLHWRQRQRWQQQQQEQAAAQKRVGHHQQRCQVHSINASPLRQGQQGQQRQQGQQGQQQGLWQQSQTREPLHAEQDQPQPLGTQQQQQQQQQVQQKVQQQEQVQQRCLHGRGHEHVASEEQVQQYIAEADIVAISLTAPSPPATAAEAVGKLCVESGEPVVLEDSYSRFSSGDQQDELLSFPSGPAPHTPAPPVLHDPRNEDGPQNENKPRNEDGPPAMPETHQQCLSARTSLSAACSSPTLPLLVRAPALPDAPTVANSYSAETLDAAPWRTPARFQSRNDSQPSEAQRQARHHGGIRVRHDKGRQPGPVQLQETAIDALVLRGSGGCVVLEPLPTINTSHSPPQTLSPAPSYSVALPTLPTVYSATAIAAQGQEVKDTRPRGRTTSCEAMRRETQAAFLTAAQSSQSAAATLATLFAASSPQLSSPPQPRLTLASQSHKHTWSPLPLNHHVRDI